jgi:hypothetical protein
MLREKNRLLSLEFGVLVAREEPGAVWLRLSILLETHTRK